MRKLRVYLDTSIINHLEQQQDNPEYMQITKEFWKQIEKEKYSVYISDIVITEINKCSEPKRSKLFEYLNGIQYEKIAVDEHVMELAERYIDAGIIPARFSDDAIHIAVASVKDCEILVSWNFKRIVKLKTIQGVNGINKLMGYREIQLVSPLMMLEEEVIDRFETSDMKELHEIREKIYEETKNMTRKEFIEYIRKKAKKAEEEMKKLAEKSRGKVN
ncbi:type II toxin-antitoxin system VapC family toxin [Caldicellulosiruptor acetigenus]|uniref:type II toxin-antitoxin system VapC family toxin n=1 Tax=Caldicellulosiruptor acetigenus TaxID=301953 RepID=UPI0003FB65FE|nr:type II toxin-antitoxin system VapC family toxin [Caldicellulosiruptor acetigenus]WAM36924.1 type II toxin-antitoxin system VapC family toxin [Caldicellulosiruptor acetigenus]